MVDSATFAQERTNCLAAKHLHVAALERLRRLNQAVDFLAIAVPILFFVLRYLFKGTPYERCAEIAWEIIAAALLVLVILKMAYHWQERSEKHSKLLGQNISMAGQAYALMKTSQPSAEAVNLFRSMASNLEQEDREALGGVSAEAKQLAYREALKEFEPGNTSIYCQICNASPWRFKPGECQMCGGTPVDTKGAAS